MSKFCLCVADFTISELCFFMGKLFYCSFHHSAHNREPLLIAVLFRCIWLWKFVSCYIGLMLYSKNCSWNNQKRHHCMWGYHYSWHWCLNFHCMFQALQMRKLSTSFSFNSMWIKIWLHVPICLQYFLKHLYEFAIQRY